MSGRMSGDGLFATNRALVARGITVDLGGRRVLDAIDLDVRPGEMVAVTGPSGSGKSTLLAVLAGLISPRAGSLNGPYTPTGIVLQGYGLLPLLTAHENVELALQLAALPRADVVARASAALQRAGLGEEQLPRDRLAEELSGGQQQRVAVARALVVDPALLVADEPTSELDAASRAVVLSALRETAERGAVVVLATHDPEVAETCDAVVRLVDGRVDGGPRA